MGKCKSTIDEPCSIAMLNYQRVPPISRLLPGGHHFLPPRVRASSTLGAAPALPAALRLPVPLRALPRRRPSELSLPVSGPGGVRGWWMALWLRASLFGAGDSSSGGHGFEDFGSLCPPVNVRIGFLFRDIIYIHIYMWVYCREDNSKIS